jgi:glycosyltransferase involved in cell wall biosynthesis
MILTIGMAHYDDYDGAYFSIQDIRKELVFNGREDLLNNIEFVVVDNNPNSNHGKTLEKLLRNQLPSTGSVSLVHMKDNKGTSVTRNAVIKAATGHFVLVMDCHVMLCPVLGVIEKLFKFMEDNPKTDNLYSGPLVSDNMKQVNTHFNNHWGSGMWGQWGSSFSCSCGFIFTGIKSDGCINYRSLLPQEDINTCPKCNTALPKIKFFGWKKSLQERGYKEMGFSDSEEFSIPSQGLGTFFVRKESWLGFNTHCRGFGGEEGYIHEKYRRAGRDAKCLSFLKWVHRFNRPNNPPYPLNNEDKMRNYILEFTELGMDISPVIEHFKSLNINTESCNNYIQEAKQIYGV